MNPIRILIADDDAGMRLVMRKLAQQAEGYELVGEAEDGAQLLKLYEKMYDDLKPKENERLAALNRLSDLIAGSGNFSGDTDDLRHILNMF